MIRHLSLIKSKIQIHVKVNRDWNFYSCTRYSLSLSWSAASPGESSHVVGLLLGGLDEAQKFELRHGADETSAEGLVEELNVLTAAVQVKQRNWTCWVSPLAPSGFFSSKWLLGVFIFSLGTSVVVQTRHSHDQFLLMLQLDDNVENNLGVVLIFTQLVVL